jgi:hypothetical protein
MTTSYERLREATTLYLRHTIADKLPTRPTTLVHARSTHEAPAPHATPAPTNHDPNLRVLLLALVCR